VIFWSPVTSRIAVALVVVSIAAIVGTAVVPPRSARGADVAAGRKKAEACAACHGPDGNATHPANPSLAGQPPFYTHWQLVLFRDGRRRDPQMSPFAANLTDADFADLAAYYASQKPAPRPTATRDAETMSAGQRLAQLHHCASCHSPELAGPRYTPHLGGQSYEYLAKQLREFKARTRGELDGATMTSAVQALREEDIEILARYFATLPPATSAERR
jgi:cytochrome c553